jgi:hypothetical protein
VLSCFCFCLCEAVAGSLPRRRRQTASAARTAPASEASAREADRPKYRDDLGRRVCARRRTRKASGQLRDRDGGDGDDSGTDDGRGQRGQVQIARYRCVVPSSCARLPKLLGRPPSRSQAPLPPNSKDMASIVPPARVAVSLLSSVARSLTSSHLCRTYRPDDISPNSHSPIRVRKCIAVVAVVIVVVVAGKREPSSRDDQVIQDGRFLQEPAEPAGRAPDGWLYGDGDDSKRTSTSTAAPIHHRLRPCTNNVFHYCPTGPRAARLCLHHGTCLPPPGGGTGK